MSTHQKPKADETPSEALRQQLAVFDTSSEEAVTVIVELAEQPAALHGRRGAPRETQLNRIRTERGTVFSHLRRLGIDVSPKHEFELAYNGFSITLPANKLPLLAVVPGIVGIHPNPEAIAESVHDTLEINAQPELVNGVPAIQAPAAWAAGFRGQGMRIAIIDDGIDYRHPDLGGCLGPGCKVIGGYDFIQLDDDPQEGFTTSGGVTSRDYHGTHVSSIAAGLKGVAPDASILGVRVLGTGNTSNLDTVMAGVEFALRNDVDVINMSIGFQNTTAQSTNPYATITGNVVLSGVVWVNSNGNDGGSGPYRPNMYGASPLVIATGNADARPSGFPRTTIVPTNQVLLGGTFGMPFPPALLGLAMPVVDVGFGNTAAAYAGKDVAGKLVIASRGGAAGEDAAFINKGNQALAAGAAGLIISNNVAGEFTTAALAVPSFTVSQANGLAIRANPLVTVDSFYPGPQISAGSSRGPTTDLLIKPDVSAPGTSVVAAVPFEVSPTGYAALSGTSMASPHVAGAAVLLRQAHPEWTPTQVKLALMNTSSNLNTLLGANYRAIEQGAGFVQIERALAPALTASPGSLTFGQLGPSNGYAGLRPVDVTSSGQYNVGVEWVKAYTGVTATPSAAQIGAGQQTVGLALSILPTAAAGEIEGYLTFTNTTNSADKYRVPFLAVHAIPVSQFELSKTFARSSAINTDTVGVSFSAGQPLADWYLGSFPNATGGHTRLSLNQGAVPAGYGAVQLGCALDHHRGRQRESRRCMERGCVVPARRDLDVCLRQRLRADLHGQRGPGLPDGRCATGPHQQPAAHDHGSRERRGDVELRRSGGGHLRQRSARRPVPAGAGAALHHQQRVDVRARADPRRRIERNRGLRPRFGRQPQRAHGELHGGARLDPADDYVRRGQDLHGGRRRADHVHGHRRRIGRCDDDVRRRTAAAGPGLVAAAGPDDGQRERDRRGRQRHDRHRRGDDHRDARFAGGARLALRG